MKDRLKPAAGPARASRWLLNAFACRSVRAAVQNDVDEIFDAIARDEGPRAARRWLRRQVLGSIPRFIAESIYWRRTMWSIIFKLGWRNIRKHRLSAAINIIGLAVGTSFCLLAFIFIRQERSFDRFHDKADRIYLVHHQDLFAGKKPSGTTPPLLASTLGGRVAEIERVVRFASLGWKSDVPVREGERIVNLSGFRADPEFFEVFSFPVVSGNVASALADPQAVILSRETARLLFPKADPVGRRLAIFREESFRDYTVAGVVDIPRNSSFRFDFAVSLVPDEPMLQKQGWGANNLYTFVLARPGVSAEALSASLIRFFERFFADGAASDKAVFGGRSHPMRLLPLRGLYLNSVIREGLTKQSRAAYSAALAGISLAVLLIACVNFTNLALAVSAARAKEVGLRKVVGASRSDLLRQFLAESMIISFISFAGGIVLAALSLPGFNRLIQRSLALELSGLWPWLLLMSLAVGFLAGGYPALILSGFQPVEVFRRSLRWFGPSGLSRALIFIQFSVSIALIIASLMMARQMRFMRGKNMGFSAANVVIVDTGSLIPEDNRRRLLDAYRGAMNLPSIISVSGVNMFFGSGDLLGSFLPVEDRRVLFRTYVVDHDFARTMGIRIVQGRDFSPDFPADEKTSVLINQTLAGILGQPDPLGRKIAWNGPSMIIGVLEDMHLQSFRSEVEPAAFFLHEGNGSLRYILVRIRPENLTQTVQALEKIWKGNEPGFPFVYKFLDEEVGRVFREDGRWVDIARAASLFVVLIACLGAFGLTSLSVVQRTKEVGIRKVLGASTAAVTVTLSKRFAVLVGLANAVAWPSAYVFLKIWLRGFAYRTSLGWDVFFFGAALTFAIAFAVVGFRTSQAARANPIEALRYE